ARRRGGIVPAARPRESSALATARTCRRIGAPAARDISAPPRLCERKTCVRLRVSTSLDTNGGVRCEWVEDVNEDWDRAVLAGRYRGGGRAGGAHGEFRGAAHGDGQD